MPLNNSGPLSFGGTTVGQSINLELGLSATATASINSTAFRTLAGVPSGQISVSNFYGKSNAIGWVINTGPSDGTGTLIPINAGIFVDAVGNMYWMFGQSPASRFGIARVSSSGVLTAFIYPFDNSNAVFSISSSRSSTATTAATAPGNDSAVLYGATLNRVYPGTIGTTNIMSRGSGAITANNELVMVGLEQFSYSGFPTIILFNSAGTSSTSYRFNALSTDGFTRVVLRTDGTIIQMWNGSGGMNYYPYSSSLSPGGTLFFTQMPATGPEFRFHSVSDASNNIFTAYQGNGWIERVNSSYVVTNRVRLRDSNTGELWTAGYSGIAVQGGRIYLMASNLGNVFVISLSASDLSMQWVNRFQLNTGEFLAIGAITSNTTSSIYATADGVFFGVQAGSGLPARLVKMPLTGMPSNSNAAGLIWTIQTWTVFVESTGSANSSSQTPTLRTQGTRTAISAGSSVTPQAAKTDIL